MTARKKMPDRRKGYTIKVRLGGQKLYLHTGEYNDGTLGEIFLTAAKTGTLLQSVLDAFAISISLGLQHQVPLEEYVEAYKHTKFEPCGVVSGDDNIKMASSIFDWVFRELENTYLKKPVAEEEILIREPVYPVPKKVAGHISTASGV